MALGINPAATIKSINPATKEVIGETVVSTPEQIELTVEKARAAFKSWRAVSLEKRLGYIERFRRLVYEQRNELAATITRESGKPFVEALVSEVFNVLETCAWLQERAPQVLQPETVALNPLFLPGKYAYNVFEPLGVIAVVSPWNYPLSIPVSSMIAALAAGNAVIFKPSPKVALIAEAAMKLFQRAGFPDGLIGLIQGDIPQAEQLLASKINRVMFTGSVGGGKAIMALAAKKLLPVTLELGGKHAAIVLKDSDIDAIAKPIIWAAFTNAGQACASIERLYVEKPIAQQLETKLTELASQLRLGDGMKPGTDVGPLIDQTQLLRVHEQVQEAVSQGARLCAGGKIREDLGGFFYEPTVLSAVSNSMRVIKEEIFGPVLPIVVVDSETEAIAHANDSPLGLGASIWTRDTERAQKLARDIEAGMVWVNDGLYTHVAPDAPWGGIKESGFGKMHSAVELRDLVYTKNIGVNSQGPQEWNYPYSDASVDYVEGGLALTHALGLREKLRGLTKVIGAWFQKHSNG